MRAARTRCVPFSMMIRTRRTIAYARGWFRTPVDVVEEEVVLDRDGISVPGTLVRPRSRRTDLPAWVVMHGITRLGRGHQQLLRFTRAIAHAGIVAIIPDVPEWRELNLAPALSAPSIGAAVRWLRESGVVREEPVGVVGFSFGAPHAVGAWSDRRLREQVGVACSFGGYCSTRRTFHFMMTGKYEFDGRSQWLQPDPYGRWVVAANYLTAVPGRQNAHDVADALRELARYSGDVGAAAWDPVYAPKIAELRTAIAEERRTLFDLFAIPTRTSTPVPAAAAIGEELEEAARRMDPSIDPTDALGSVPGPVHLLHGRRDHLIPCAESRYLSEALPIGASHLTVTRLFGHSAQERVPLFSGAVEVPLFARALGSVLGAI